MQPNVYVLCVFHICEGKLQRTLSLIQYITGTLFIQSYALNFAKLHVTEGLRLLFILINSTKLCFYFLVCLEVVKKKIILRHPIRLNTIEFHIFQEKQIASGY